MASFPWYEAQSTLDEGIESISIGLASLHCTVPDAASFCEKALEELSRSVATAAARVVLLSDDGSRLETLAERGLWHAAPADGLRTSLIVRLVEKDSEVETAALPEGSSEIAFALRHDGRIFGVLQIAAALQGGAREGIASLIAFAARSLSIYLSSRLKLEVLRSELDDVQREMDAGAFRSSIVGRSLSLASVIERVKQVAPTDVTVLIEGENGTGKELIARAIHGESRRADKPWVVVNCAAIPSELLESELFGHERGAFTNACERRIGKFEQADGGTIFLDEIGEMPLFLQAKILRFLQERTLQRLGSARDVPVDVRFVAATNRDLTRMRDEGTFREDLYWRLYVVPIRVPALRERPEDIEPLARHFLRSYSGKCGKEPLGFGRGVLEYLAEYRWPGNVRELENLIHRLVVLSRTGEILEKDLPDYVRRSGPVELAVSRNPFDPLLTGVPRSYEELLQRRRELARLAGRCGDRLEDRFVDSVLDRHRGNKSRAAEETGMHRTLIHRNLRKRRATRCVPLLVKK